MGQRRDVDRWWGEEDGRCENETKRREISLRMLSAGSCLSNYCIHISQQRFADVLSTAHVQLTPFSQEESIFL